MTKLVKTLLIIGAIAIPLIVFAGIFISVSNEEVGLRNEFNQKDKGERPAFYDKMTKIFKQQAQIAVVNDSSFRKNINIIMAAREDGDQLLFKMVTEANPNANYSEVSALYKNLTRSIEAQREEFFELEKTMQDIKLQHDNLITKFPNNIICSILGKKPLDYTPITSSKTEKVMESHKDDDVEVFTK